MAALNSPFRLSVVSLIGLMLPMFLSATASAEEIKRPLYEVEALVLTGYTPDYPGSSQMHAHVLPLPWVVYRGAVLRTEERGTVQGRLIDTKRFGLDVSVTGSFPVSSDDNDARAGMPDLDWMGEIGPKARLTLASWRSQATGRMARVNLELPVRAVLSTDFKDIEYRGLIASPAIAYDNNNLFGGRFKLGVGPMFGTSELTEYFYQVDPAYARGDRPSYDASAGYMGLRTGLRFALPVGERVTVMGASNFDVLNGAANENSPLMKDKTNIGLLLGVSVSLYKSTQMVSVGSR